MTNREGTDLGFATPTKSNFVSGQLRTETCSTAKKTKRVISNMAAKCRQQNELIKKLREQILKQEKEITEIGKMKKMCERLFETTEQKRKFEAKRAADLEQQLKDLKERESRLNKEVKLSSDKLTKLNESLNSKTSQYDEHVGEYKQKLLSKNCTLRKLERELQNLKADNVNLRKQIQKLREVEQQRTADHDKAVAVIKENQKQCEVVSKKWEVKAQMNLKRWQQERRHLEEDSEKRILSLQLQCIEKDDMLKQKELALEEFRVKQGSVLTEMEADMRDLRAELSNQIKVNGKLKHTYEDLRVGTNLKIKSLTRRVEGLGKYKMLMPSNSEDIQRIKQILAVGCSDTGVTLESSPRTPMPSIRNPEIMSNLRKPIMMNLEPQRGTIMVRSSPAFNRSVRSTLQRKRAFQKEEYMTGNSKRRRLTINCTHDGQNREGNQFQLDGDGLTYCTVM